MQGRDSFVEPNETTNSLHDPKTQADLQAPKFFTPTDFDDEEITSLPSNNEELYDSESSEYSTQLENLQQLLEIAHQNEENAKKDLAEKTIQLAAAENALKEMKHQLTTQIDQNNKNLQMLDTQQKNIERLTGDIFNAISSAENDKKAQQRKYNETQHLAYVNQEKCKTLEKKLDEQVEDSATLKTVILKQDRMLKNKDKEIAQLKTSLGNVRPPHAHTGSTFFRDANITPREEPVRHAPSRNMQNDW